MGWRGEAELGPRRLQKICIFQAVRCSDEVLVPLQDKWESVAGELGVGQRSAEGIVA